MACYAMRAVSALLVLVVALCLVGPACAAPVATYDMVAAVSGTSYFWQVVQTAMGASTTVDTLITSAIQSDLAAAAGTDVTVAFQKMSVNASAMFVSYTATPSGTTPTQAEVEATVASSATFPSLTAAIATLTTTTADIADLVPTSLSVTTPLYPDPDASSSSSTGYTFVSSVDYEVVVLFTGEPSAWSTVLASDRATVSANIVSAVQALMDSSKQQNDVTVTELSVLAADPKKKSMGSGSGGLTARLSIVCSATAALTGRYLSTDEYANVLLTMDTATLSATFQASSSSTTTVVVEETTSSAALGVSDKCDSSCKGMIAMTAVIVALAIVAVVITVVAIACPCCCVRAPREAYVQDMKNRGQVETEVAEAIDVYGEDLNAEEQNGESHAPTTVLSPTRRNSNEPTEA